MVQWIQDMTDAHLCKKLEFYETPEWAVNAILRKEILTREVVDPCVGRGVLARAAFGEGYRVVSVDVHKWGVQPPGILKDFLVVGRAELPSGDFSVLMNPPFSKACEFVDHSFALGARKVVAFQRFAWLESEKRQDFWSRRPPNRIYLCKDRATCWRGDIPVNERGKRFDPATGRELSDAPTAHAWFVWEPEQPGRMQLGYILKDDDKEEYPV